MSSYTSRIFVGAALVIGLVFCQATQALAGATGQISGTVTDAASHVPIAGAQVSAVSPSGTYKATTSSKGFYVMLNVYPDTYTVTASATGYQSQAQYGITTNQDQTSVVNLALNKQVTTLGVVVTRGVTAIVQPTVPADQYAISAAQAYATNGSGGSYGIYQTPGIIATLPGVTTDQSGYTHIRGGRVEEVGFEYDGVTTVEPVTGTFSTNLVEDGISRLVVATGGYPSSGGNAISGIVNTVVGVGTYPGHGSATFLIESPTFYHGIVGDYGSATADGRFSWYVGAVLWNSAYDWGDRHKDVPSAENLETSFGASFLNGVNPSRDQVLNLHYKFGSNLQDDLQLLTTTGIEHYDYNYLIPALFFPSQNPVDAALIGLAPAVNPTPTGGFCDSGGVPGTGFPLFPGQTSCTQRVSTTDHDDQGYYIDKVQLTHSFSPSANLALRYARVGSFVTFYFPFGGGAFDDLWQNRHSDQQEAGLEFTAQVNSQNLIKIGGQTNFSTNYLSQVFPSSGFGLIVPANNYDRAYWIQDTFRPFDKLTLDLSGRRDLRTYFRVTAPTFTDGASQGRFGLAYAPTGSTVIRGSWGNFVELPYVSRVERILTLEPNFQDISPANRFTLFAPNGLLDAQPDVPQSHLYDATLEQDLGHGLSFKGGPFWRNTTNLVLTFHTPGQPAGLPQAVGPYYVNGIEAELAFQRRGDGWSGYINYTHERAQAEVTGDYNQTIQQGSVAAHALFPVNFVPPNAANLVATWTHGHWHVNPVVNYVEGYPYGLGAFTYNNANCPFNSPDPLLPACGAVVKNPAAYYDTGPTGNCDPGFCTALLDPRESKFADGRVCCKSIVANLNVYYDLTNRTQVGVQWQNLNRSYQATSLEQNFFFFSKSCPSCPGGFNGFVNYGPEPYVPASVNGSEEFLFTVTQRL